MLIPYEVGCPMKKDTRTQDLHIDIKLAALEELAAAMAIFDLDGTLTYANVAFMQLWRFESPGQALGLHVGELWVSRADADKVAENLRQHATSWTRTLTARRADGATFPARMVGKVVRDGRGLPVAHVGTFTDLSATMGREEILKPRHELGLALGAAKTLDEVLKVALDAAIATTGMELGWIYLVEADGGIRLGCHYGLDDASLRSRTYFSADSAEARIIVSGEPLCSAGELPTRLGPAQDGLRGFCGLPVKFEDKVLAWLGLASSTVEVVQDEVLLALMAIAGQLGRALAVAISRHDNGMFISEAAEGFCLVDRSGRFLDANEAYCRMLGYTREEMFGKRVGDIEARETLEETILHIRRIREKGHDRFCTRQRHKSGMMLDVEVSAQYSNLRGGVIFAFMRDVTAQLAAQDQLAASEARYRAVVESQTELIRRFDADCRLTFVNKAYCRNFAMTREALLGVDWLTLVPDSERASLRQRLARLCPADPIATYELRVVLPDGTVRWQEWSDRAIFDRSGVFLEFQSSGRDITEHKTAVEALVETEKRAAAEKTLEIQRALSIRSDRLRALGEMAAGIAHELNQPLVGVRGLAEHLLLGIKRGWNLDQDRVQKKLQGILDQADRMSHIIQHVRNFSQRSEKASFMLVNLNDVVATALELMEAQLRARGLVVERFLAPSLPRVLGNPFSLEEVVLNCLTNARDAIEERLSVSNRSDSPCRVTLRTRVRGRGKGRQVLLEISDTGIGISDDILEKVFDPFFTTKRPDRGTGLGLSISTSIVEDCGGTLSLRSRPMSGTTVTVALPVGGVKA